MKIVLALFCCLAVASASVFDEFEAFKTKYNKVYNKKTEHGMRFRAFAKNLEYINKHNEEHAQGKHTFRVAVNELADLTNEEYRQTLLGMDIVKDVKNVKNVVPKVSVPDSVDWRDEGYVTDVKDQKQCGSCWAFSATGSMEGAIFKRDGELVSLSEQNLVDCDPISSGCNGGLMDTAFSYAMSNGINTEEDYPYEGRDRSCRFDDSNRVLKISGYEEVNDNDEDDLTAKIAEVGPVSVAIDAGRISFQFYSDGVYYEPSCSSTRLNHGVLAVGYGTDSADGDYYIVKNSWGQGWGNSGYIWMSRGRSNNCGIATDASYALG